MKTKHTDVVAEYLHEVDQRLAGLPVLQRRELLADLRAHIETERAERNLRTEGELIEVLERLGSPEVVAAAAHEEAGTRPAPVAPPQRSYWPWVALAGGVLVVLFLCFGAFFMARGASSGPVQAPAPAVTAPPQPEAGVSAPVPTPTG
ncbi:HAAS signaling domain-containing protein [Paractinoplanes rishiriensis]|uniref:Uncharacterized protein n=1 Tax=Paractinoplanes rishiriensis TaxID=1050105 RepID=A0A919N207_9ACTN|nr:hypothetical protein [Actinoplanes rishiriensis]GIE98302.1 hypothetical protein Ari01nite_57670 [Actinoplanes rishiriensis]